MDSSGTFIITDQRNQTIRTAAVTRDGDTNGDGTVNAADIFYLINYLFVSGPEPIGSGDADHNNSINVSDLFYLMNYLFTKGPPP